MAVRRVRRIIRKIDPWTVLKVALILNTVAALVFVLGLWVMWSIAVQRGIPDRLSDLAESLTLSFTADGALYFRVVLLLAVIGAILGAGLMTLFAVLYNLVSDVVGGIEVVVLEETFNMPAVTTQARVRPAVHRPSVDNGNGSPQREPAPIVADSESAVTQ